MFPMTVTITNTAQLNAVLAAMEHQPATPITLQAAPKAEVKEPEKKSAAAATMQKQEAAADTPSTAEVQQTAAPEQKPEASKNKEPEAKPTTYQEVVTAINALAKGRGKAKALEVLQSFGVNKGPELKPEQYADVAAAANAVAKGE